MLPNGSRVFLMALAAVSVIGLARPLAAQRVQDKPIVATAAGAKFGAIPNAPACFTVAVERGDPGAGPSVILANFAPGCVAPFHWHTPSETVMIVSGSLEVQMKDDRAFVASWGFRVYARTSCPSGHLSRFHSL